MPDSAHARLLNTGIALRDCDFLTIRTLDSHYWASCVNGNQDPFVFTSAYAVQALSSVAIQLPSSAPPQRACFCIEGRTSKLARAAGFSVLGTAVNSAELAQKIIQWGCKRVLYCTTRIRLTTLTDALNEAGVEVKCCEVYEKKIKSVRVGHFDGIIFFSPSQVDAFLELNKLEETIPAFCIGKTTACHLQRRQHLNTLWSPEADINTLLDLVIAHYHAIHDT